MTATRAADDPCARREGTSNEDPDRAVSVSSFRLIYDTYFDFVWSCARHLGIPSDAIDDVVQEIFLVVHARLHTVEQPASLRSWLYGVVRRTASTYRRGRRSQAARESSDAALDTNKRLPRSPLDLALLREDWEFLWRLLDELDARKREVLVLSELNEMTVPEIADAVGIPVNTAYSRLRAARQEFNDAFLRYRAARERSGREE